MVAGFSCAELARRLGMRPATLGRIERGERGLRIQLATQIAEKCNCRLEDVVGHQGMEIVAIDSDDVDNQLPIVGKVVLGIGVAMSKTGIWLRHAQCYDVATLRTRRGADRRS